MHYQHKQTVTRLEMTLMTIFANLAFAVACHLAIACMADACVSSVWSQHRYNGADGSHKMIDDQNNMHEHSPLWECRGMQSYRECP